MKSWSRVTLLPAALMILALPVVHARDLTFDERVDCQEAIERVYYSHQVGATQPFEQAVSRQTVERKVRRQLRQSVALDTYWKTPLTAEAMRRELERIAAMTRFPGRLREIYNALGGGPVLVQECFARPLLADRLSRNFFAFDGRFHAAAREEAEALRGALLRGEIDPAAGHPRRSVSRVARRTIAGLERFDAGHLGIPAAVELQPFRIELDGEDFLRWRSELPPDAGEIGRLEESRDAFTVRVVLAEGNGETTVATYTSMKTPWEDWWASVREQLDERSARTVAEFGALPPTGMESDLTSVHDAAFALDHGAALESSQAFPCSANDTWDNGSLDDVVNLRHRHSAVWTGNEMIVWGGTDGTYYIDTGGRYDPLTDIWMSTSTIGAPAARVFHTAIWTGSEMIVWGGDDNDSHLNTGGRYDPVSDTWSPTSTAGAPSDQSYNSAVWTGTDMLVWKGASGGRYDPATDSWTPISPVNSPGTRSFQTAVWTGTEMILWGGGGGGTLLSTGGRYDPVSDTWMPTSTIGAPNGRAEHTAIWTGSEMIVWGGADGFDDVDSGGRYDPASDSWISTSSLNAPTGRSAHTAVWTGSEMLVWGGSDFGGSDFTGVVDTGGRYDPASDSWTTTSTLNAPSARIEDTAIWSGSAMIVWGGGDGNLPDTGPGGRYDPATDSWTPTAISDAPAARRSHSAIWTGTLMVIWGGTQTPAGQGSRYDPLTDTWSPVSTVNAPASQVHAAAWSGNEMLVWGGFGTPAKPNSGGRYDPIGDLWTPMSAIDAPSPRINLTGVWTGSEFIVWGGFDGTNLNDGGRYDPIGDDWTPIATAGAPVGRNEHSAVWTGSRMIVWGGRGDAGPRSDGGVYDKSTDSWNAVSTVDAPAGSLFHSALWTGDRMVVWGGYDVSSLNDEGHYDPVDDGGQYDPVTDTWAPTSAIGAPSPRRSHSVVWTGKEMVIWGGYVGGAFLGSGARYDPVSDDWTPTTMNGAPSGRAVHSAVWTGDFMIVWGGTNGPVLNDGGRYVVVDMEDDDGDGFTECDGDCDDTNPAVHPNGTEVCNGLDDDCNDQIDEGLGATTCGLGDCERTVSNCIAGVPQVCEPLVDTTPPVLVLPAGVTAECVHPVTTPVAIGAATASDSCCATVTVGHDAAPGFPLGDTPVTWTAVDCNGLTTTGTQTISIVDTTPPAVSVALAPATLWPPNHRMMEVEALVGVTDQCSSTAVVLSHVVSSEVDDGVNDGDTIDDIQGVEAGTADFRFDLRAERADGGGGRIYTAVYEAIDAAGNAAQGAGFALVPHDQGGIVDPIDLRVEEEQAGTMIHWSAVAGAQSYDIIRSSSTFLRDAGHVIDLGPVVCIEAASTDTTTEGREDPELPAVGEAFLYFVEYFDGTSSSYGTESAGKPRAPGPGACP